MMLFMIVIQIALMWAIEAEPLSPNGRQSHPVWTLDCKEALRTSVPLSSGKCDQFAGNCNNIASMTSICNDKQFFESSIDSPKQFSSLKSPTEMLSTYPSDIPTDCPTEYPSVFPPTNPTLLLSSALVPSSIPGRSRKSTDMLTMEPTTLLSNKPSSNPSSQPTLQPRHQLVAHPSGQPMNRHEVNEYLQISHSIELFVAGIELCCGVLLAACSLYSILLISIQQQNADVSDDTVSPRASAVADDYIILSLKKGRVDVSSKITQLLLIQFLQFLILPPTSSKSCIYYLLQLQLSLAVFDVSSVQLRYGENVEEGDIFEGISLVKIHQVTKCIITFCAGLAVDHCFCHHRLVLVGVYCTHLFQVHDFNKSNHCNIFEMAAVSLNNSLLLQHFPNNVLRCDQTFSESDAERVESLVKQLNKLKDVNMQKRVEKVVWMCNYHPQKNNTEAHAIPCERPKRFNADSYSSFEFDLVEASAASPAAFLNPSRSVAHVTAAPTGRDERRGPIVFRQSVIENESDKYRMQCDLSLSHLKSTRRTNDIAGLMETHKESPSKETALDLVHELIKLSEVLLLVSGIPPPAAFMPAIETVAAYEDSSVINARSSHTLNCLLHVLCKMNHSEGVLALLKNPALRVDLPDQFHNTALFLVVSLHGNAEIVRALVKRGANCRRSNEQGISAWDYAERASNKDLSNALSGL